MHAFLRDAVLTNTGKKDRPSISDSAEIRGVDKWVAWGLWMLHEH